MAWTTVSTRRERGYGAFVRLYAQPGNAKCIAVSTEVTDGARDDLGITRADPVYVQILTDPQQGRLRLSFGSQRTPDAIKLSADNTGSSRGVVRYFGLEEGESHRIEVVRRTEATWEGELPDELKARIA